jgi:hypothetical protein
MTDKKEPEFIDRINNPDKYPYIENEDGSISTHQMAAETDEEGNWYVFPTIVMLPTGELYQFKDTAQAMNYNMRTNNFMAMKSKKEAIEYAKGGYKKGTALEKFNPITKVK